MAKPYGSSARRKQLLETISEWIAEAGLDGFSFRGAAGYAGVTVMTLVRYFRDRDGLLSELIEFNHCRDFDRVRRELGSEGSLVERFRRLAEDPDSYFYDFEWSQVARQLTPIADAKMAAPEFAEKHQLHTRAVFAELAPELGIGDPANEELVELLHGLMTWLHGIRSYMIIFRDRELARKSYREALRWFEMRLEELKNSNRAAA